MGLVPALATPELEALLVRIVFASANQILVGGFTVCLELEA